MSWKKVLNRVVLFLLVAVAVVALVVIGTVAYDSIFPSQRASDFTNVTFQGDNGIQLQAYLTGLPQTPPAEGLPAVLLIHEFTGINQDIVQKADLLAQEGYVVLAVDAYRGISTRSIPRAIWLVVSTPQERVNADLDAAYDYLESLEGVDPMRIGAVGFCYGGTQAMLLGIRNPDPAGTVIFYGSGLVTDPQELGRLGESGPVLGIFGAKDSGIPISDVRGFEDAMQARGIDSQVTIYPNVGHAFVKIDTLAREGEARQAWQQMLAFLEQNLH